MSHELLLVAGRGADPDAARRRRDVVTAAAASLPDAVDATIVETPFACVGVAAAGPAGGDVTEVHDVDDGTRITLAFSPAGLDLARRGGGHRAGAERGHVSLLLGRDGAVEVTTDGFATIPTYWAARDDELCLSTHLASLVSLGVPPERDERGVLEYLAMLHPLGRRTILAKASLLPAGARLSWPRGGAAQVSARPLFAPRDQGLDDDAAVAAFADTWRDVMADLLDRCGQRVLLGLSGGLDSRIMAAQAVRLGHRPLTYTYGEGGTHEVATARRVAEELGLAHVTVPTTDDDLLAGAATAPSLLDGAHAPTEMYELWFADRLRSLADAVVNGLAGGPLWGEVRLMGLVDPGALLETAWARYEPAVAAVAPLLAHPGGHGEVIRQALEESLADFRDVHRPDVGVFWQVANRQARWGNMLPSALRRIGIRPETPFLDGRVLAFTAGLTPQQRLHGRLYLRVQKQLFPETAAVPRSDDGNAPQDLDHVYWASDRALATQLAGLARHHPVAAARRALRQGVRIGAGVVRDRTGAAAAADALERRATVFPAELWARTRPAYARRLAALLEPARDLPGVFDEAATVRAIDGLASGAPTVSAAAVGRVAAMASWLDDHRARHAAWQLVVSGHRGERPTPDERTYGRPVGGAAEQGT